MKKIIIIMSILILMICFYKTKEKYIIPTNSIRVRVIANSNNIEDQLKKVKVKNEVEEILYKKLNKVTSIEEARTIINDSIPIIETEIKTITNNDFKINYGENYFPEKEIYGISYKEGNYESLVIDLGKAKGKNWWCVLFPPICMIEAKDNDKNNIEYKSKVLEIIKEYS